MSVLDRRVTHSLSFFLLAIGTFSQRFSVQAAKPWDGIYTSFPIFWGSVTISVALVLITIHYNDISWKILVLFVLSMTTAVVSHSLLWARPWGYHDSWRHIGETLDGSLLLTQNVYPSLHALTRVIASITGLTPRQIISGYILLTVIFGLMGIVSFVRRSKVDVQAAQMTVVAVAPLLFLGFIPRPFTLTYPFLLIILWSLWLEDSRIRALSLCLAIVLILFHPFIAAIAMLIVLIATLVFTISFSKTTGVYGRGNRSTFLAVGVGVVFVLIVESNFGGGLILSGARAVGADVGPSSTGTPAGAGLIRTALFERVTEFLLRASFLLALAVPSGVAVIQQVRQRAISSDVVVATLSGLFVLIVFLLLSLAPTGIGLMRLLIFAPVFFVPLIPYALRHDSAPRLRQTLSLGFALVIVVAGLGTAFVSPAVGGIEYSATESQVQGVQWSVVHTTGTPIVGSRMTHWMIVGLYGRDASTDRSRTNGNGMWATKARNGTSYQSSVDGLIAVDGAEIAYAEYSAKESNDVLLRCLHVFQVQQNQVYTNGEGGYFTHARTPSCVVASQ